MKRERERERERERWSCLCKGDIVCFVWLMSIHSYLLSHLPTSHIYLSQLLSLTLTHTHTQTRMPCTCKWRTNPIFSLDLPMPCIHLSLSLSLLLLLCFECLFKYTSENHFSFLHPLFLSLSPTETRILKWTFCWTLRRGVACRFGGRGGLAIDIE